MRVNNLKSKTHLLLLVVFLFNLMIFSCSDDKVEVPNTDDKEDEKDEEPTTTDKEFIVYDMLSYVDKPDLSSKMLSDIGAFHRAELMKNDDDGKLSVDINTMSALSELIAIKGNTTISLNYETNIENGNITDKEIGALSKQVYDYLRFKNSKLKISSYSSPVVNLSSFRYENKDMDEEKLLVQWRKLNERRWSSFHGDYYSPVAFINTPDFESWSKDLKIMIDEIKEKGGKRKIYIFLSPQYEFINNNPHSNKFIEPAIFKKMLDVAYELADGVILSNSTTEVNEQPVSWDDTELQSVFKITEEFIESHKDDIALEVAEGIKENEPVERTSFMLFHSINFESTPDLSMYNMTKVHVATEEQLSNSEVNGVSEPDVQKIEQFAVQALENPDSPVLINLINSWIHSKNSDNEAVKNRFKLINESFKAINKSSQLMFHNVGPASISANRLDESKDENDVLYSWFMNSAYPTRALKEYADAIVPAVFAIDDNVEVWKKDFNMMITEAKVGNKSNKPIYVYLWTNYFNSKEEYPFFDQANEPIKEDTFYEMLETIYDHCDGAIIVSNDLQNNPTVWDDDMGIAKAISRFYEKHKDVIGEAPSEGDPSKEFAIFDAMSYPGKPSLEPEGIMPVYLIYETHLTKPRADNPDRVDLDIDKVAVVAELSAEFPNVMVSTDVEDWWTLDQYEMSNRFSAIFDKFREKNPSVTIGNYSIGPSALCVTRYYDAGKTDDGVLVANWRKRNETRWKTLESADVAFPVAYIAEPNVDSWERDLKIATDEVRKYSDKKIYVYIWPQYYDKPDSPHFRKFVSPEIWTRMLEAAYKYSDGVILWSSTKDEFDELARWKRPELQAMWQATKSFMNKHSANMVKPKPEPERIFIDNPNKKFKMFSSFSYAGTPNLASLGLNNIKIVSEQELSNGILSADNIYEPETSKIESLAREVASTPSLPVFISGGTWIRDRTTNPQAMIDRHRNVSSAFKNQNSENPLSFSNVGPTSLSGIRTTGSNFFTNMASWKSTTNILRPLREHVDVLVPASYILDDNITLWKREFYLTIKDAKINNPGKPIYAHFYTDYFNQTENFENAYKPIKESTFTEMLEAAFKICDGIILTNLKSGTWNDQLGFAKSLEKFASKHKTNIVFPEQSTPDDDPDNIIVNGSFENPISPAVFESTYQNIDYMSFVNLGGFFDSMSRTTSPNLDAPVPVGNYEWFERGTTQSQCRTQIDHLNARSGTKSAFIWNIGGNTSNATAGPKGWNYHNLAQRVSLDDSKKYEFSFYAKAIDPAVFAIDNTITEVVVGIISSTDAKPNHNFTYFQRVPIQKNTDWKKISVTLDLPAIIADPEGHGVPSDIRALDFSFESSAVFISVGTNWDDVEGKTLQARLNVDDVRLVQVD